MRSRHGLRPPICASVSIISTVAPDRCKRMHQSGTLTRQDGTRMINHNKAVFRGRFSAAAAGGPARRCRRRSCCRTGIVSLDLRLSRARARSDLVTSGSNTKPNETRSPKQHRRAAG